MLNQQMSHSYLIGHGIGDRTISGIFRLAFLKIHEKTVDGLWLWVDGGREKSPISPGYRFFIFRGNGIVYFILILIASVQTSQ